jgi:hypothetical protein
MKPKILIYDIETAPIVGTVWGKYEQNLVWSIQDWYILCFSYRWLGERKRTVSIALPDYKLYKKEPTNDYEVVRVLHRLFSEADVVVAHNGNSFDQKKAQARMILHGMPPPVPYQQVDTKLMARRSFSFTSNKLDDLGEYFGFGKKHKTDADLWRKCMAGDMDAWKYMRRYCDRDVELLEKVYLKMRPWDASHPNMANIADFPNGCRVCVGSAANFKPSGTRSTRVGKFKRWQCNNFNKETGELCMAYNTESKPIKREKPNYV